MNSRPVAFVTGASRGIGEETALAFARHGYDLAVNARDEDALERLGKKLQALGAGSSIHAGDLADVRGGESMVTSAISRWGRLDVLVNNAAWRTQDTMRSVELDDWEKTLRICLTTPAFLARTAAAQMETQASAGVIINVSSIVADRAPGFGPAYVAAKGALDSLTYDLAALYSPTGIRVVGINPGAIDTAISQDYETPDGKSLTETLRESTCDQIPLRRWGRPEEVAGAIVWLASDSASYVSGTTLTVDGGWSTQLSSYRDKKLQFPKDFS